MDKLGTGKLEITPVDLSKLSDVAKDNPFKKTEYVEMVKNVHFIDISKFFNKANYGAKIKDIEHKIPSVSALAAIADLNAKTNEAKVKCLVFLS